MDGEPLIIYTDGSSFSSPRRGGAGILFVQTDINGNEVCTPFPVSGNKSATNNHMELRACVLALQEAHENSNYENEPKIIIRIDSRYVANNYKIALYQWSKSKWKNADGKPILNAEEWKALVKILNLTKRKVTIEWIKGHSKDKHNKTVDKLAKASAKGHLHKPLSNIVVRRKLTTKSVVAGCVPITGQRLSIRIISTEYLKLQKISKYKYEVISKKSHNHGDVDTIFSKIILRAGHSYYVRFNDNHKNPEIVKLYKEII